MLPIGTVKGGVILKTAQGIDPGRGLPGDQHFPRHEQTLDHNVFPDRGARRLSEDPVEMRLAQVELAGQQFQRKVVSQMTVDVLNDPGGAVLFRPGVRMLQPLKAVVKIAEQRQQIAPFPLRLRRRFNLRQIKGPVLVRKLGKAVAVVFPSGRWLKGASSRPSGSISGGRSKLITDRS